MHGRRVFQPKGLQPKVKKKEDNCFSLIEILIKGWIISIIC